MNSNFIINNSQENEIDKILQEGIDKSLLYMKTLNMNNSNEINTYSTTPISQTTKNLKSQTFNKKRKISKNKTQNLRPISAKSATTKNNQIKNINHAKTMPKSKSNIKIKKINKKQQHILDYQLEYNKKKYELDKYKNQLIQERIKQNQLQKEMNSKIKKEEEFKKIEENNNIINNNSEELILKIQRSEKIREEQSKIIDELLKQYNEMIKALRNNPGVEILNKYRELESEAESLKHEGNMKIKRKKKKKLSKKIINDN